MNSKQLKIGDSISIETFWADPVEFPNCRGTVSDLRFGGAVAIIETQVGHSPRTLHVQYLR